jgi:pimeloyl-ACP methyl ester carboxylesterase
VRREDVTFPSGDGHCAAWVHRPPAAAGEGAGDARPCVVMAHGFALTRHDGLPAYAERLAEAGLVVVVFDHRHLGDSSGLPRQRFRLGLQREDWRSAVAFARTLDGVDPGRLVLWGYSISAAHVLLLAATAPAGIAAALVLAPFVDGLARALATPPRLTAWIVPRALADALGRHTTIPVTAPPGRRGAMTLPGEADGFARAVPEGSPWRNRISPAIFLTVAALRPVRLAPRISMPLWVGLGERDVSVPRAGVERLAARAPQGTLARYPHDHFGFFLGDAPARIAADQVAFLRAHGLVPAVAPAAAPAAAGRD